MAVISFPRRQVRDSFDKLDAMPVSLGLVMGMQVLVVMLALPILFLQAAQALRGLVDKE